MIKQNLHREYYHSEWDDHERQRQKRHISKFAPYPTQSSFHNNFEQVHCIEFLREAIMCKADVSIMTFRWVDAIDIPVSSLWSSHECVKWETVEEWANDRRLNLSESGLMVPKPATRT